jgi:hypothetical protein
LKLQRDPLVDTNRSHALHVAGPRTERKPIQHVSDLLVGGLLARLGRDRGLGGRDDVPGASGGAGESDEGSETNYDSS